MQKAYSQTALDLPVDLNVAEERTGYQKFKIRKAIRSGLIPSYRFANGRILVRVSEILAAVERSRTGGEQ